MKEKMTETKNGKDQPLLIDKITDKVSDSKLTRALFLGATLSSGASLVTACTPPPAEVAPLPSNMTGTEPPHIEHSATVEASLTPEIPVKPSSTATKTATPEPTATATEVPTATEEVSPIPEGFQLFTEITGLDGKVYDVTTVEGLKAMNETNSQIVFNNPKYRLPMKSEIIRNGIGYALNYPGIEVGLDAAGVNDVVNVSGEIVGVIMDPSYKSRYLPVVDTVDAGLWPVRFIMTGTEMTALGYYKIENGNVVSLMRDGFAFHYPNIQSFLEEIKSLPEENKIVSFFASEGRTDSKTGTVIPNWVIIQKDN